MLAGVVAARDHNDSMQIEDLSYSGVRLLGRLEVALGEQVRVLIAGCSQYVTGQVMAVKQLDQVARIDVGFLDATKDILAALAEFTGDRGARS